MSQPGGVWKFIEPRSASAPGGVPMSSGTMKVRAASAASSRVIPGLAFINVTSSLIIPSVPTGRAMVTEKIGSHLPLGSRLK